MKGAPSIDSDTFSLIAPPTPIHMQRPDGCDGLGYDAVMLTYVVYMAVVVSPGYSDDRINLVDSARVVEYTDDTPETIDLIELKRAENGWTAWKGPGDQYMIGVEWDEPRDITELNVEFRHAVAHRSDVKVQYWHDPALQQTGPGTDSIGDPFHGEWVTAKGEFWAGDRDISIAFAPYREERNDASAAAHPYRRTYRLRFLLGEGELPPVRYIRAYGPDPAMEAEFDLSLNGVNSLKPPLHVSVVNGAFLDAGEEPTTKPVSFKQTPITFRVRFAKQDTRTPTRTVVTVRGTHDHAQGFSFLPAEAVAQGQLRIPSLGATIRHRGSTLQSNGKHRETTSAGATDREAVFDVSALRKAGEALPAMCLPLGLPDSAQEFSTHPDGSISLYKTALGCTHMDESQLDWPGDAWTLRLSTNETDKPKITRTLHDGYLPIVVHRWQQDGVTFEQTFLTT